MWNKKWNKWNKVERLRALNLASIRPRIKECVPIYVSSVSSVSGETKLQKGLSRYLKS